MGEGESQGLLRRFVRDFGLYSVASFVPAVLGVLAIVIFTRMFPPGEYGRYALTLVFVLVSSTLLFGWLRQAVLRFQTETDRDALLSNLISLLFLITAIVTAVGIAGYFLLSPRLGSYEPFYVAAVVFIPAKGLFRVLRALFRARLESKREALYRLVQSVLKLGIALVLAIVILESIVGWLWGATVATVITVGIMLSRLDAGVGLAPTVDRVLWTRMFRFGVPLIGWLLGLHLLNFVDRFLLELIRDSTAVGIYSSNYTLVHRGLLLVLTPIIQAVHPLVMDAWEGDNPAEIRSTVTEFTRYFLVIAVPATVFAGLISRPLSALLLGAQYHPGHVIIPIVAVGLFLWNLAMIGHKGLEVRERTMTMSVGVGIAVVVNALLNVPLIAAYGYVGAAVATLVSFAVYPLFVHRVSRPSIPWRVPWRTVRNTLAGGAVMAVFGGSVYAAGLYTLPRMVAVAVMSWVAYAAVLYTLGEFRRNELIAIKVMLLSRIGWRT